VPQGDKKIFLHLEGHLPLPCACFIEHIEKFFNFSDIYAILRNLKEYVHPAVEAGIVVPSTPYDQVDHPDDSHVYGAAPQVWTSRHLFLF